MQGSTIVISQSADDDCTNSASHQDVRIFLISYQSHSAGKGTKSLEVLGRYATVGPFAAPNDCSLDLLAHQSLVVHCSAVDASYPLQCAHSDFMHIVRSVPHEYVHYYTLRKLEK